MGSVRSRGLGASGGYGLPVACPATLDRRQPHSLVNRRHADECVHHPAGDVGLPEVEPEDRRNQVELGDGHQASVQPAHNQQGGGQYVQFLHFVLLPSRDCLKI